LINKLHNIIILLASSALSNNWSLILHCLRWLLWSNSKTTCKHDETGPCLVFISVFWSALLMYNVSFGLRRRHRCLLQEFQVVDLEWRRFRFRPILFFNMWNVDQDGCSWMELDVQQNVCLVFSLFVQCIFDYSFSFHNWSDKFQIFCFRLSCL
jgi:hypothetical protein